MGLIKDTISERTFDFQTIFGPSFKEKPLDEEEWQSFIKNIRGEKCMELANLWYNKACLAEGVPQCSDFSFEELVKFGTNIFIAKQQDEGRWMTTFCGSEVVEKTGFDSTGKYLDEIATDGMLEYWKNNFKKLVTKVNVYIEYFTLEFANRNYTHCTRINFPIRSSEIDLIDTVLAFDHFSIKS